jgi:3-hydroxyanthranilate 3,4-dioxygenase
MVQPFNLNKWIDETVIYSNHLLNKKNLYQESGDYIVMCCRPNARKDYHYNETEELFYQLEGSIKIVIQEEGVRKEMEPMRATCICILPMFLTLQCVQRVQ